MGEHLGLTTCLVFSWVWSFHVHNPSTVAKVVWLIQSGACRYTEPKPQFKKRVLNHHGTCSTSGLPGNGCRVIWSSSRLVLAKGQVQAASGIPG